jgi:hypothetical protein
VSPFRNNGSISDAHDTCGTLLEFYPDPPSAYLGLLDLSLLNPGLPIPDLRTLLLCRGSKTQVSFYVGSTDHHTAVKFMFCTALPVTSMSIYAGSKLHPHEISEVTL